MEPSDLGLAAAFHDPAPALAGLHGSVLLAEAIERDRPIQRAYNWKPDRIPRMTDALGYLGVEYSGFTPRQTRRI